MLLWFDTSYVALFSRERTLLISGYKGQSSTSLGIHNSCKNSADHISWSIWYLSYRFIIKKGRPLWVHRKALVDTREGICPALWSSCLPCIHLLNLFVITYYFKFFLFFFLSNSWSLVVHDWILLIECFKFSIISQSVSARVLHCFMKFYMTDVASCSSCMYVKAGSCTKTHIQVFSF